MKINLLQFESKGLRSQIFYIILNKMEKKNSFVADA